MFANFDNIHLAFVSPPSGGKPFLQHPAQGQIHAVQLVLGAYLRHHLLRGARSARQDRWPQRAHASVSELDPAGQRRPSYCSFQRPICCDGNIYVTAQAKPAAKAIVKLAVYCSSLNLYYVCCVWVGAFRSIPRKFFHYMPGNQYKHFTTAFSTNGYIILFRVSEHGRLLHGWLRDHQHDTIT